MIFPFYPKTKQKQVDAKVGRSHAPPWVMVAVCCYSLQVPKKKCSSFFLHLLRAYSVFDFICGVPRFPDMVFAKKPESDFNAVLFRDISKLHVPRFKKESIPCHPVSVWGSDHFWCTVNVVVTIANAFYAISQGAPALPFLFMTTKIEFLIRCPFQFWDVFWYNKQCYMY